jgi:phosphate-selective porin OprO and OprP
MKVGIISRERHGLEEPGRPRTNGEDALNRIGKMVLALAMLFAAGGTSRAQEFLLGPETKGVAIKAGEDVFLAVRIRLQPRFDAGDLIGSRDGSSYDTETDFYLRRVRLEMTGSLVKNLRYNLTFNGDRTDQAGRNNNARIHYAYLDYKVAESFAVRYGRYKLPYSRVALASSARQLLVERPVSVEAAKRIFGGSFDQTHLLLHGRFGEGLVAYGLAVADGWEPGQTITGTTEVHKAGLLSVARLALSPPGWVEPGMSDAHLGKGRHLALGVNAATQRGIEYAGSEFEEDRTLWGTDLSFHLGSFTAQVEYNAWRIEPTDPAAAEVEPRGWYAQLGYFIPGVNIEPAVRYEVYEQDSNRDETKQRVLTAGLNWYLKGHGLKIQANYVMTEYDRNAAGFLPGDDTQDIVQIQGQLYF